MGISLARTIEEYEDMFSEMRDEICSSKLEPIENIEIELQDTCLDLTTAVNGIDFNNVANVDIVRVISNIKQVIDEIYRMKYFERLDVNGNPML